MTQSKITLGFFGTDEFARIILERLLEDYQFQVLAVVTPPDRPVGRKQALKACPVKAFALERGLSVLHSPVEALNQSVDFLIVASYGEILPETVLDWPKYASLNVHGSLLPQYRGASPVQAALLNGDRVTGVSIQHMIKQLDAGPVYALSEVAVRPDHTGESLRLEMAYLGGEMLAQVIPSIVEGAIDAQDQDNTAASYCGKITKADGKVNWEEPAEEIWNRWRAYTPWPGLFTFWQGKRLKLLHVDLVRGGGAALRPGEVSRVSTGDVLVGTSNGALCLNTIQLEGKGPMSMSDFLRGYPDFLGATLGE